MTKQEALAIVQEASLVADICVELLRPQSGKGTHRYQVRATFGERTITIGRAWDWEAVLEVFGVLQESK